MRLSLITPTRGRPRPFALLERWVARMAGLSVHAVNWEWIVGTDDAEGYEFTRAQRVVRTRLDAAGLPVPPAEGAASLCSNLAAALQVATGDVIVVLEDDDWYGPAHVQRLLDALEAHPGTELVGTCPAYYYHLPSRRWQCMGNKEHASLAQTGFRRSLVPHVLELCARGHAFLDVALWRLPQVTGRRLLPNLDHATGLLGHIGMKGLPGTLGIGVGHRAQLKWQDPTLSWLEGQIGAAEIQAYEELDRHFFGTES